MDDLLAVVTIVGVGEPSSHRIFVLVELGDLGFEFDRTTEFGQPTEKCILGIVLWKYPEIRILCIVVDAVSAQADELFVTTVETLASESEPLRQNPIEEAHILECLKGPWINAECTGTRHRRIVLLKESVLYVPSGEFNCQR